jgi:PAS domain S-box-containing protein
MSASFHGFRSLIENSPDAISLIDARGEVLYASASNTKVLGYQPEELVGRNGWDLIHPEDRDHASSMLQTVLSQPPVPLQWHARLRRKDGTYCWVESTVSNLLVEPEVNAIVVSHRDINARRAAEAESQRHAEKLARTNLELEEFAYTVAHDLREPLRTISAFTALLARIIPMDPAAQEMTNFIVDGAARMSTLVEDLLTFAHTGKHDEPTRVDLKQAVAQSMRNLAVDIQASGALVTFGALPTVQSNEIELVRLFQNLIGNAVKYRRGEPPAIHVSATQQGSEWTIRVKDDGIGISPEDHARVFQPFIRLASREIPGTGLGLAVCKKIVEGLGGTIWVESELGVGSTFSFTMVAAEVNVPILNSQVAAV